MPSPPLTTPLSRLASSLLAISLLLHQTQVIYYRFPGLLHLNHHRYDFDDNFSFVFAILPTYILYCIYYLIFEIHYIPDVRISAE
jgi:hypothetical protein